MKKLLLAIGLIATGTCVQAQEEVERDMPYETYVQTVTENLNTELIPFGVLYDRVEPMSNLDYFVYDNDSAVSSTDHFFQALHEFQRSHNGRDQSLSSMQLLDRLSEYERQQGVLQHPLGILFAAYGQMYPSAVNEGLIGFKEGKFADIPGKNPYRTVHSCVVSALSSDDWEPGAHQVALSADFVTGNDAKNVSEIRINFNDGQGWQSRSLAGKPQAEWSSLPPFTALLDSAGDYIADVEMIMGNDQTLHTHFAITAKKKVVYNCDNPSPTDCPECVTIGGINGGVQIPITADAYPAMNDYNTTGTQATGKAYIFYANQTNYQQNKLRKPVIFIDGYDPSNSRCARNIYSKYIDVTPVGYTQGLAEMIRASGYDLIILDFTDGGRHIEENAMVVKKTLETLYQQYGSGMEKDFVLIGPSMGALVSQFALTYMEHVNVPHHVRTWISFDGPHKGANVAKGVTDLIQYMTGGNAMNALAGAKLDKIKETLYNNPAARQMLIHHPSAGTESPAPDAIRATFLSHLAQNTINSYPQNCRKVAVVNGSLAGVNNTQVSSCAEYANIKIKRLVFPPVLFNLSAINSEWSVRGTTAGGRCQDGHFYTLWPLANIAGIPIGWTNYYSQTNSGLRGLDACPGSSFGAIGNDEEGMITEQVKKYIKTLTTQGTISFTNYTIDIDKIGKTTFIPTVSAIDYIPNNDMYTNLSGMNLTSCSGNTPFDKVYGSNNNTDHVAVDANIAQAFLDELDGKYDGCPIICSARLFGSTKTLCLNQQMTLNIDNPPPANSTLSWTVSSGLQILSQSNTSITVKATANNASGWIKASITPLRNGTACSDPVIIQYDLTAGSPYILKFEPLGPTNNCHYKVITTPYVYGNTYSWSLDGTNYTSTGNTNMAPFNMDNPYDNGTTVYCKVVSACGPIFVNKVFLGTNSSSGTPCPISGKTGLGKSLKHEFHADIFPNPAFDYWTVQIPDYLDKTFSFKLTDVLGKEVFTEQNVRMDNSNYMLDGSLIAKGIYLLRIDVDGKTHSYKLIKQ
jgi:triacylglycerol esterase/lipase EstA (alpha/beta hydrolase family)